MTQPEAIRPEDTWPEWLRDRPNIPLYALEGAERWRMLQGVLLGGVSTALLFAMLFAERIIDPFVLYATSFTFIGGGVIRGRGRPRVSIVGAIAAIAAFGANATLFAGDVLHPESWGSFIPAGLVITGIVASTGSAVAGLRNVPSALAPNMVLGVIGACFAIVASSLVASIVVSSDGPQSDDRFLLAAGSEFTPTVILPAGVTGLVITNDDMIRHTFVIEGTANTEPVRVELPATKARRIEITLPAGEYRYFCDLPLREMEGILTVR